MGKHCTARCDYGIQHEWITTNLPSIHHPVSRPQFPEPFSSHRSVEASSHHLSQNISESQWLGRPHWSANDNNSINSIQWQVWMKPNHSLTYSLLVLGPASQCCEWVLLLIVRLTYFLLPTIYACTSESKRTEVVPVYLDATAQTLPPGLACRWKTQPKMYIQLLDMWMSPHNKWWIASDRFSHSYYYIIILIIIEGWIGGSA